MNPHRVAPPPRLQGWSSPPPPGSVGHLGRRAERIPASCQEKHSRWIKAALNPFVCLNQMSLTAPHSQWWSWLWWGTQRSGHPPTCPWTQPSSPQRPLQGKDRSLGRCSPEDEQRTILFWYLKTILRLLTKRIIWTLIAGWIILWN